jgi:hypothetical protein
MAEMTSYVLDRCEKLKSPSYLNLSLSMFVSLSSLPLRRLTISTTRR